LIRGEVTTFVSWSKYVNTAVIVLGLSLALLVVLFFGLIYWETIANQEGEALVAEIKQIDMQINQLREDTKEVDQFQRRMNLAGELLDKHIYWTKYFDVLENILLKEARITNTFSGSLNGVYNFSIEVNSFEAIYNQLRFLREHPAVLSAQVDSGTFVESNSKEGEDLGSKVEFKLELALDPEIFFDKNSDEK
jgi:Tfp pilus assembly protein PilN